MSELPCPSCKSLLGADVISQQPAQAVRCHACGTSISVETIAAESFRRSVLDLERTVEKLVRATSDEG